MVTTAKVYLEIFIVALLMLASISLVNSAKATTASGYLTADNASMPISARTIQCSEHWSRQGNNGPRTLRLATLLSRPG